MLSKTMHKCTSFEYKTTQKKMLVKTEEQIGNIEYTRHRTKKYKTKNSKHKTKKLSKRMLGLQFHLARSIRYFVKVSFNSAHLYFNFPCCVFCFACLRFVSCFQCFPCLQHVPTWLSLRFPGFLQRLLFDTLYIDICKFKLNKP